MQIERNNANELLVNGLPDGSKVIVDAANERVYALNATAGAAWDACQRPTTVSDVAEEMRQEELGRCGSIDLVEFFGGQGPFQPRIGGLLNQCHENSLLPASSLYFHVWMWYTAANLP